MKKPDLRGRVPESWSCIDCGINTAPGMLNREQMEQAFARDWNDQGVNQIYNELSEVYTVEPKIWKAAGMEPMGGCLCIGCLEKRLGRTLTASDFPRDSPVNKMPGTGRLLARRDGCACRDSAGPRNTVGSACSVRVRGPASGPLAVAMHWA